MNLNKRVEDLESRLTPRDGLLVLIVSFLGATDGMKHEPVAYVSEGQRWERQPGETLEALKARASKEVPRKGQNVGVLREEYA